MPIEIHCLICYNTSTTKARKPNKKGNTIMECTYYINGIQRSEWEFLEEMVAASARLDDFVEVANGYTYTAGNDMYWVVKGE